MPDREIDDAFATIYGESLESLLDERFKQTTVLEFEESPHLQTSN